MQYSVKFSSYLVYTEPNCIDVHFQVFGCRKLRTVQVGNPWNLLDNPKIEKDRNEKN